MKLHLSLPCPSHVTSLSLKTHHCSYWCLSYSTLCYSRLWLVPLVVSKCIWNMGCALVIFSLYPLYTFGRPSIWQALNKYFLYLYWITSSCFPSKNCTACSNFPWNIRTDAKALLFLFATHIACQNLQELSPCFLSHFSCQFANAHHKSSPIPLEPRVAASAELVSSLFCSPLVLCLRWSNALREIYFHAHGIFVSLRASALHSALCVLPVWSWPRTSVLSKHRFWLLWNGKVKSTPYFPGCFPESFDTWKLSAGSKSLC